MAKKKDSVVTKTKEMTSSSLTSTGESLPTIEEVLGKKSSPPVDDGVFLLKLKSSQRLDKILLHLNVETAITSQDKLSLVIGPFSRSQIVALCGAKLLARRDELMPPQGNWKGISEVIQEVKIDQLLSEDMTSTASVTESITETSSHKEDSLIKEAQRLVPPAEPRQSEPKRNLENFSQKPLPLHPSSHSHSSRPASSALWGWLALTGLIVTTGLMWHFGFFSTSPVQEIEVATPLGRNRENWPESMREKNFSDVKGARAPLLAQLDPILEAYERGAKVVSETDLRLLKVLSGPGSASLEARVTATNLLAALALSRSQTEEAKRVLDRLLEIVPTDSTTLLNRSLSCLVSREYKEAKEFASTALRLCKDQSCWVSRSILGFIAGEESKWDDVEENFNAALEASRGSLWVVGLWLRSLKNAPKEIAKAKMTSLLTESLVLDPDLMVDSPLHAPFATQVFLAEVVRGFRNAMSVSSGVLTEGQKKYFEWLMARFELTPLSTSATEASDILKGEAGALSQLAAAYLEKENNRLDVAAEILSRTLPRISTTQFRSSWPWSFSGDIQRNRGLLDQAVIRYEGALNKNPRDVNAVFGLALILREKKEYKLAGQKIEEALALDPNYVPAQLKRDRFEWQRHWFSK